MYFPFHVLQGDFLLIVLKNLIEKQSSKGFRKLKIILMYANLCFILLQELTD